MPRYYFDIADDGISIDDTGLEYADDEAARVEAVKTLPAIAAEALHRGGDAQDFTIQIRDAGGRTIYLGTLSFTGGWVGGRR